MALDVLSDVLRAVRLTGVVYFDFDLTPPWVAEAPASREIAATVLPGAERVFEYHLLVRGSAWGHVIGSDPIRLKEGDFLVFPQGDAHVLSSAPGMRSAPDLSMYARASTPLPLVYELGAGGGPGNARLICGFFGCDERPYNPLLAALPRVIHIAAAEGGAAARPLAAMLDIAVREERHGQPGTGNVLSRVSELMFVEALRRYLARLPGSHGGGWLAAPDDFAAGSGSVVRRRPAGFGETSRRSAPELTAHGGGWLAGLRDPIVGRALQALHDAPAEDWTIERLGRNIGVSRSVLAARFTGMVGHPPMQYLALWRMQLASAMLRDGRQVVDVAAAVGYESEAAFSRAFKKLMGTPPMLWRRSQDPPARGRAARAHGT